MSVANFDRRYLICIAVVLTCIFSGQVRAQDGIIEKADVEQTEAIQPIELKPLAELQKEIRKESSLPGAKSLLTTDDASLRVWIPKVHLGIDNVYNVKQMRYFSARVWVLNHGAEDVTIHASKSILKGWNQSFKLGTSAPERNLMPISVGRDSYPLKELKTPDEVTIPKGEAGAFWVVFTDLPKTNILQEFQLGIETDTGTHLLHDIRKEQSARLGILSERIGPEGTLGLVTIHGLLNSVNAQDLADELSLLGEQKVQRVALVWDKDAASTEDDLIDWLLHRAAHDLNNELYMQFPPFEPFKFLALGKLPLENAEAGYESKVEEFIYETAEEAALAGLEDLFAAIDAKYISREIRQGHPFSQRAALAALEFRQDPVLNENLFPILSQLYDTADEATRPFVLLAIGQQAHPQALEMLSNIATMEEEEDSIAAIEALVKSNQQAAVGIVLDLINTSRLKVSPERLIEILAANFRREWNSILIQALDDKSPEVRSVAMEGLVKVGHPELARILQRGLKDSSKTVRETAFTALIGRVDRDSEKVAADYALSRLEAGQTSDSILEIISRTKDQRAAPLILKLLEEKEELREELLPVLEEIGDQRTVRQLLKEMDQFKPDFQIHIYDLATKFDLPEQFDLAKIALRSKHPEVRQMGVQMLTQQASDTAADEIAKLLPESDENQVTQICYALGRIGTKRAEELLKEFRQKNYLSKNATGLKAASNGLRLWMNHSPGWNAVESAFYHSNVDSYDNALVYFDLAAEIDPNLGVAFSGKGNSLLKLKRYDEALAAFQKAYEIDEFDGQAVTGIGILRAMQGETAEAVQFTLESKEKFPEDNIFAYNTACVYGRAIEYLRKEKPVERAEIIQQYELAAINALKDSIEYGFEEFELMRTDPDIESLRQLPKFKELLEN